MKLDGRLYLKVKIISLADEARTIRRLEKKAGYQRTSLRDHRVRDVRSEARASIIAYNFLRGKSYDSFEKAVKNPPDWKRVEKLVSKYCYNDQRFSMLLSGAITAQQHTDYDIASVQREALVRLEAWKLPKPQPTVETVEEDPQKS